MWAPAHPDRLVAATTATGTWQLWAFTAGRARQLTSHATGVEHAAVGGDGRHVAYFADRGDETGHWAGVGFDGSAGGTLAVPCGFPGGAAPAASGVVVGVAGPRLEVWAADLDAPHRTSLLLRAPGHLHVAAANAQAVLLAGDEGCAVAGWDATLRAGPDGFAAAALAPDGVTVGGVTADGRVAVWVPGTRPRQLALDGHATVHGFYPDGAALLAAQAVEADAGLVLGHRLWRVPVNGALPSPVGTATSTVLDAAVRPGGTVWARRTSTAAPPEILDEAGRVVFSAAAPEPSGHPGAVWIYRTGDGEVVGGFLVDPGTKRPAPLVVFAHGGPFEAWENAYHADVQVFADAGYLVALPNYRGSSGRGARWADAVRGNPGLAGVADLAAGVDDLVARGVADPARVYLFGLSWGGYLGLLAAGVYPQLFRAVAAVAPIADPVTAWRLETPPLRRFDRHLYGAGPRLARRRWQANSPMSYCDAVRAPILVFAGRRDRRCPIAQIRSWEAAMRAAAKDVTVVVRDAGHGVADQHDSAMLLGRTIAFFDAHR